MSSTTSPVNFLLLVELIVVVIAASAFLFYWNRVLGSAVAFFIRLYAWKRHSAYISIGSLQLSPLAGRISFRDIEYHSSNLSVRALHGHVTFRYWILRVRHESDTESDNVKRNRLPCRINVFAEGVECFVFNRTPAYDAIVERMKKHEKETSNGSDETLAQAKLNATTGEDGFGARLRKSAKSTTSHSQGDAASSTDSAQKPSIDPHTLPLQPQPVKTPSTPGVNWLREALPLELHLVNGTLLLGSDSTPSLLVCSFHKSDGTLEISDSRSICDEYKLSAKLVFDQPSVLMRTNVDYSGPILAHGKKVYEELYKKEPDITRQPPSKLSSFLGFSALSKRFEFIRNPKFSSPPVTGLPTDRPWKGLARYRINDERPKAPRREERDYAKVTTLVKAESLEFTYYADTPGPVPHPSEIDLVDDKDEFGNVDLPPEYGVDITIRNGVVNYGPWSDRQRDALQRTFAPSIFFDSDPKPKLQPGDTRIHSNLLVNVQFADRTTLRIPTREPSKDWEFEHKSQEEVRTYGWLDVVVGPESTITYTQSQFATKHGYDARLLLHLDALTISSSVNYLPFLEAKACKLSMAMPTPLSWNARRDWDLDITMDTPQISLLRDHVQLISDLAKDWSSGARGDFHHFVPNHYKFRVALLNYGVHLCLNDFNIIDAPLSRDQNAFMDISGLRLESYTSVAGTEYRPDLSTIPFSVNLQNAAVALSVPSWDTHRSFADQQVFEIGKIGYLSAEGSYTFYSAPDPDHQEQLILHLEGKQVVFVALGWVLRRLFCTKDNYFGSFTQFATSAEFLERFDHDPKSVGNPIEQKYQPGRADAFAVQVTMAVDDSLVMLSDQIHGMERGLAMPVPELQMALKSGEHFMELSLDVMPTYIVATDDLKETYRLGAAPPFKSKEAIFVEGLQIHANRLFGPQPRANTYLCLWELVAPRITAYLSPAFLVRIQTAVAAVLYNFDDVENAPASFYVPEEPPDVTFFKLGLGQAAATLFVGDNAISIDVPEGVNLDTSSLATRTFSSSVGLIIPSILATILERDHRGRNWHPTGRLSTSLTLDLFKSPAGWQEKANNQQIYLREEDGPSRRVSYMWDSDQQDIAYGHYVNTAYLPSQRPARDGDYEGAVSDEDDDSSMKAHSSDHGEHESSISSADEQQRNHIPRPFARRRTRSVGLNSQQVRRPSIGDESDDASDVAESISTTASSLPDKGLEMASALADSLRSFRSAKEQTIPIFPSWEDEQDKVPPSSSVRQALTDGKIIRIRVDHLDVDLSLRTAQSALTLARAFQDVPLDPEVQLDKLLVDHTDAILDNVVAKTPTLIDLTASHIRARVGIEISPSLTNDLHIAVHDVYGSTIMKHIEGGLKAETNVVFGSRLMTLTMSTELESGHLSLSDIGEFIDIPGAGTPVLQVNLAGIAFGFHSTDEQNFRIKAESTDLQAVTAAAACLIDIVHACQNVASAITASNVTADREPPIMLLYRLIEHADSRELSSTAPSFFYEGGYELHAQDQRSIRRDPGWLMIARFRHWLRHIPVGELPEKPDVSPDKAAARVVTRMARLDDSFCGDETLVTVMPFMKQILPQDTAVNDNDTATKSQSYGIFVNLGSFSLRHHGRLLESHDIATSFVKLLSVSAGVQISKGLLDGRTFSSLRLLLAVKEISSELQDSLLPAFQKLLALVPPSAESDKAIVAANVSAGKGVKVVVLDIQVNNVNLSVLAGGLRLRLAARNLQQACTIRDSRDGLADITGAGDHSHGSAFTSCESIELALLQPQEESDLVAHSPDRIVVALTVRGLRGKVDHEAPKPHPSSIKLIVGAESVDFDSRPQLRAFLAFARQWQKRHLGLYRPLINDIRALACQRKGERPPAQQEDSSPPCNLQVDLSVLSAQLQVRAAKAVWLRWEIGKIFISRHGRTDNVEFGVRIAPQFVGAYATLKKGKDKDASSIKLPSLIATGSHRKKDGRPYIAATVGLGFFVGILKPAIFDRLLSLHQRLGSDIIHIVEEYRSMVRKEVAAGQPTSPGIQSTHSVVPDQPNPDEDPTPDNDATPANDPTPASKPLLNLLLDLKVSVAGVRFGLRADDVTTTLLFEALSLRGSVSNTTTAHAALMWRIKAEHFGLSLGHLSSGDISDGAEPIRKHRSAKMVFDVDVEEIPGQQSVASQLSVSLSRIHSVMHIAALSELTELVRSWQSDIHLLRDSRADEVAEVKSHTNRLLKKMEADKTVQPEQSWFASRLFTVQVFGFGLAIPLDGATAIDLQHRNGLAVPALLFSVRKIGYQNRKNETARFRTQRVALQFVERFDQGTPEHFMGDYHPSVHRMLLPSLDSEAQMSSSPEVWSVSAHFSATDFKLSLAPDVITGVFKLIDLYEHGKERLTELEGHYRRTTMTGDQSESVQEKYGDTPTHSPARPRQQIVVRMSYTFNSGIVELHRPQDMPEKLADARQKGKAAWHDSFVLPTVSIWVDYEGPHNDVNDDSVPAGAGELVVNTAVHESRNTLRPTILPFFVDLVNRIERRHRSKPSNTSIAEAEHKAEVVAATVSESTLQVIAPTPGAIIHLRFTLRIDRSQLRLSCAPDSNAYVDVEWESGGFMASTSLGSDTEVSTVAGSISGVTASLSHEFADKGRSCVEASAKDMAFSVTYCPARWGNERGLSIVLDSQLAGQFRLDAFSAWLIFTSVWIDNAPHLDIPLHTAIPNAASAPPSPGSIAKRLESAVVDDDASARPKLAVVALVRFGSISLDTNIAVTKAKLEITPVVLRTISNGEKTEVDLQIGTTQVIARGDISGSLRSDKLVFNTMRRSSRATGQSDTTVLAMSIDAGDLRGGLFLGNTNILRYHLEPAFVSLADDWKDFHDDSDPDSQVSLAFSVRAGNLSGVLRLLAIPGLLGHMFSILDMVESQQRIALQRSETFKANRERKRDERSPVAAAILQTARRASAATTGHVRTIQSIRFDLAGIDIGVFNEDHGSGGHISDFYRFVVGKVEADLKRQLSKDNVPQRDLGLLISLIQWDYTDGVTAAAKERPEFEAEEMIQAAWKQGHRSVASLPSMTMTMESRQLSNPDILDFDFDLVWGETDGDIGILPNFFEQAISAFRKLAKGIEQQNTARMHRINTTIHPTRSSKKDLEDDSPVSAGPTLEYRPRDPTWANNPPIPKLKQLGESTREAATFIPRIKSATKELPVLSHRFVTLPLEEGMCLLLKLYEKQLPEKHG